MLIIGTLAMVMGRVIIKKGDLERVIFNRISLGIICYSLIISLQSWVEVEGEIGIMGGLMHQNNIINGVEIYILLLSLLLLNILDTKENYDFNTYISIRVMILFSLLGMILLICSYDLISTFLSLELQSLSLYIITTITKKEAISAGLKYYLLGSLSTAILLLGCLGVYIVTGVTQYDSIILLSSIDIGGKISMMESVPLMIMISMIMVGLLFKIGAAPFHSWAPDVYDGVPTTITSWIAIMGKISILILLQQIIMLISSSSSSSWSEYLGCIEVQDIIINILAISVFLSLIIGSALGLVQHKVKRLLAYSSISHIGFILLGLISYQNWVITGLISFLFYMFQYWISLICTFAILIYLGKEYEIQYISFLKGLYYLNPLITLALIINLFSLAGIPPLIGFFGKQMVLYTSLLNGYYLLSIIATLTSVVSAAYYLKIIPVTTMYKVIGINEVKTEVDISTTSWIISILTLITLFYFLNPVIILDFIHLIVLSVDNI